MGQLQGVSEGLALPGRQPGSQQALTEGLGLGRKGVTGGNSSLVRWGARQEAVRLRKEEDWLRRKAE